MKIKPFAIYLLAGALVIAAVIISSASPWNKHESLPVVRTLDQDIWEENFPGAAEGQGSENNESAGETVKFPVDLNAASAEILTLIDGIGEKTAERIIEHREQNGLFESVDGLEDVEGIGSASIEKWRGYLYVETPEPADTETTETQANTEETGEEPGVQTAAGTESAAGTEISAGSLPQIPAEIPEDTVESGGDDLPLIDLNTATAEELTVLYGIGPATAEKITEYARETGFSSVDDLLNVSGIGEKKLEGIRPYVTVNSGQQDTAR